MEMFNEKPVVFFDLEATGTDTEKARIIEIGAYRLESFDVTADTPVLSQLVNPGEPIPAEVTEITGITDEQVSDKPYFGAIASKVVAFFENANVCAYNGGRYDVPLLNTEFKRLALPSPIADAKIIDPYRIFKSRVPHKLETAYTYYTGKEIEQDHRAINDIQMMLDVLKEQLIKYDLEAMSAEDLESECLGESLDWQGHFSLSSGVVLVGFGKHRGRNLLEVSHTDRDWFKWASKNVLDFKSNLARAPRARSISCLIKANN